jgi:hypothetical protein
MNDLKINNFFKDCRDPEWRRGHTSATCKAWGNICNNPVLINIRTNIFLNNRITSILQIYNKIIDTFSLINQRKKETDRIFYKNRRRVWNVANNRQHKTLYTGSNSHKVAATLGVISTAIF